ncbi:hypothetical protein D6T64_01655 [Cryobacterium melibiosiphilum]|uniref:Uncharacterized protein n=1 Tax=Cryobacterium melibiosiphilum TaxID=995039 RepID=A0A3A5N2L8_9MICO|nr:hypothetical protein [Cryobacterium melibiosiphilum]RJT91524.1 hypothetical protein D6T64_01655 [Cryobacterium melibiosiphilum]
MSEIEFGTWNDNMQFMVDSDGIACAWGSPNSGEVAVFAALKMTAEQWEAKKTDLIAIGASEDKTPIVGYVLEPEVDINVSRGGFAFRGGEVYYVSSDHLAEWIPPLTE